MPTYLVYKHGKSIDWSDELLFINKTSGRDTWHDYQSKIGSVFQTAIFTNLQLPRTFYTAPFILMA